MRVIKGGIDEREMVPISSLKRGDCFIIFQFKNFSPERHRVFLVINSNPCKTVDIDSGEGFDFKLEHKVTPVNVTATVTQA